MNVEKIRQGSLFTAIKTPYLNNGKIDLTAYDFLVERQIKSGVDGLIVGGTTGEGHLMNWDEHIMLIAHSVHKFGKHLIVVGNTGSNNTREAIHATEQGFAVGIHSSLQINPYYGKTSYDGLVAHFETTLNLGPAIIYNVPGRTGQDMEPEFIHSLAKHPNFVGVKECAGNQRIQDYESQGICCWSGNDDEAFEGRHLCNSHGVISVTSNILPSLIRQLMDQNEVELNESLSEIFHWLFADPNPIPLNTIMSMMGLCKPVFRLPYVPLVKEKRIQGKELFEKVDSPDIKGPINIYENEEFVSIY